MATTGDLLRQLEELTRLMDKVANPPPAVTGPDKAEAPRLEFGRYVESLGRAVGVLAHTMTAAATSTTALLSAIDAYTGGIGRLNRAVALFDPGTAYLFDQAVRNMGAAIGRVMVPAVQLGTRVLNAINSALSAISPTGIKVIAAVAGAGAVMAALAVIAGGTAAAVTAFAGALALVSTVINTMTAGIPGAIGLVVSAVAAAGLAAGSAAAGLGTFSLLADETGQLMAALAPILTTLVGALEKLAPRMIALAQDVAPVVVALVQLAAEFAQVVLEIATAKGALEALAVAAAVAAVPFVIMLSPLIALGAAAVVAALALHRLLRALGLISGGVGGGPRLGGQTFAASPAAFTSGQAMAEKAYANAYSLGDKDAPTKALTGSIIDLTGKVDELLKWLGSKWDEFKKGAAEKLHEVGDAVGREATAPNLLFRGMLAPIPGATAAFDLMNQLRR